jgi:hypothetical protein
VKIKIVEVAAKARKELAHRLEYVPASARAREDASDTACASVTVRVVVDPRS